MDIEEGTALADAFGAAVLWIEPDGRETMTGGFESYISE